MKISWISALIVLPAAAATGNPGGGVTSCTKYGTNEAKLKGGEFIERGTGICTNGWTLGITEGKGKLQLLKGDEVRWRATDEGGNTILDIEECRMQEGGAFVCKDEDEDENRLWVLNCGGDRSSMHLNQDDNVVLRMRGNSDDKFKVKKNGNEIGTCDPNTNF